MAITNTGTATSFDNLIDSLLLFAENNGGFIIGDTVTGVTINSIPGIDSTSDMKIRQVSKDGVNWCFCYGSGLNFVSSSLKGRVCLVRMCYSPVPSDGTSFTKTFPVGQTKYTCFSAYDQTENFNIPYRFIQNENSIHCIIEPFQDAFSFISFGAVEKFTAFTGGEFLSANSFLNYNYSSSKYEPLNSFNNNLIFDEGELPPFSTDFGNYFRVRINNTGIDFLQSNTSVARSFIAPTNDPSSSLIFSVFYRINPNPGTGRSAISPSFIRFVDVNQTGNNWILSGEVAGVGAINISNFAPKDITNTNWIVYPLSSKTGDNSNFLNTANFGIAYYIGP